MTTTVNVLLRRYIDPIKRRIQNLLLKGSIKRVTELKGISKFQVETFKDDVKEDIENYSHFGFKSAVPKGSETITASLSGNNEHVASIATEHLESLKKLPDLKEGESILYDSQGNYIHLKEGNVEIIAKKIKIQNDSEELISVLSDIVQQVRNSQWNSIAGPLPIFEADGVKLDLLKQKLDTFKL